LTVSETKTEEQGLYVRRLVDAHSVGACTLDVDATKNLGFAQIFHGKAGEKGLFE